jgi:hypothetical protein
MTPSINTSSSYCTTDFAPYNSEPCTMDSTTLFIVIRALNITAFILCLPSVIGGSWATFLILRKYCYGNCLQLLLYSTRKQQKQQQHPSHSLGSSSRRNLSRYSAITLFNEIRIIVVYLLGISVLLMSLLKSIDPFYYTVGQSVILSIIFIISTPLIMFTVVLVMIERLYSSTAVLDGLVGTRGSTRLTRYQTIGIIMASICSMGAVVSLALMLQYPTDTQLLSQIYWAFTDFETLCMSIIIMTYNHRLLMVLKSVPTSALTEERAIRLRIFQHEIKSSQVRVVIGSVLSFMILPLVVGVITVSWAFVWITLQFCLIPIFTAHFATGYIRKYYQTAANNTDSENNNNGGGRNIGNQPTDILSSAQVSESQQGPGSIVNLQTQKEIKKKMRKNRKYFRPQLRVIESSNNPSSTNHYTQEAVGNNNNNNGGDGVSVVEDSNQVISYNEPLSFIEKDSEM